MTSDMKSEPTSSPERGAGPEQSYYGLAHHPTDARLTHTSICTACNNRLTPAEPGLCLKCGAPTAVWVEVERGAGGTGRCMFTEEREGRVWQCDSFSGHPGDHTPRIDLSCWSGIQPGRQATWHMPIKGAGVYVASRSRHGAMWRSYRDDGYPIVSTWINESGEDETSDWPDLWARCIDEARTAAACILYAPAEDGELKGALVEVGAALAGGRAVYFVGDATARRYSWIAHPNTVQCDSLDEALALALAPARHASVVPTGDAPADDATFDNVAALRLWAHDLSKSNPHRMRYARLFAEIDRLKSRLTAARADREDAERWNDVERLGMRIQPAADEAARSLSSGETPAEPTPDFRAAAMDMGLALGTLGRIIAPGQDWDGDGRPRDQQIRDLIAAAKKLAGSAPPATEPADALLAELDAMITEQRQSVVARQQLSEMESLPAVHARKAEKGRPAVRAMRADPEHGARHGRILETEERRLTVLYECRAMLLARASRAGGTV